MFGLADIRFLTPPTTIQTNFDIIDSIQAYQNSTNGNMNKIKTGCPSRVHAYLIFGPPEKDVEGTILSDILIQARLKEQQHFCRNL